LVHVRDRSRHLTDAGALSSEAQADLGDTFVELEDLLLDGGKVFGDVSADFVRLAGS